MKEKCGLFAAFSNSKTDVIPLVTIGLRGLQHRGQEAWGIATPTMNPFKQNGLVTDNLDQSALVLQQMKINVAIGHVRYSTAGGTSLSHAQPFSINKKFCIAHNGTVCDLNSVNTKLTGKKPRRINDTSIVGKRLLTILKTNNFDWFKSITLLCDELVGAYCFVILTPNNEIYAFRDTRGFRPLCIGWHKKSKTYLVSSESCAFSMLGAELTRDVNPGEIIKISNKGLESHSFSRGERTAHCSFEYIYFAHPSSVIDQTSVYESRRKLGQMLAEMYDVNGDVVVPVPDSARPAALGFSEKSGIPMVEGLMKDRYAKRGSLRSFIQPKYKERLKINRWIMPVKSAVDGKDVIVIDDSIVRGISSRAIVKTLRNSGAKSVKILVTYPPIRHPCRAGIDFPTHEELIAYNTSGKNSDIETINKKVGKSVNADFVGYNTVENLSTGIGKKSSQLCMACHDGEYGVLNRNLSNENLE
ncbi:MAG: amidophosphoribosyltransferase [Thaumarchaeota archaeon]|nr:amidophosphoribosyltransferase [Nitrososphaerota archaeon]|tara:strand:+ start:6975 stop:8390 length:1416 start_codon:yes stop_codon:yes gene_type:complete